MVGTKERRAVGLGEFAGWFGISKDSAKRHVKNGDLRVIRIGARVLVPMVEVERVEKEGLGKGRKAAR